MKYTVNEIEQGVDISIADINNRKGKLLEAFQECQEGRCACPTGEDKKLESLEIEQNDNNIQLYLKSMQGTIIDKSEIEKCLEFTVRRVEEER